MTIALKGFRYPANPSWIETWIARGLWQIDHESGCLPSIYRSAPGGQRSSFFTVPAGESLSSAKKKWYPSLAAAAAAVEMAAIQTVGA